MSKQNDRETAINDLRLDITQAIDHAIGNKDGITIGEILAVLNRQSAWWLKELQEMHEQRLGPL